MVITGNNIFQLFKGDGSWVLADFGAKKTKMRE